jgi:hypothetical protein
MLQVILTYTEQKMMLQTSSETKVWLLLQNLMVLCFDLYILVLKVYVRIVTYNVK